MNWSADINKKLFKSKPQHYRRHWCIAKAGFIRDEAVWLAEIALAEPSQGDHCPYCGGKADPFETLSSIESETGDTNDLSNLYYRGEFKCSSCKKWWVLRSKVGSKGAVIDFNPPRNPTSHEPPYII